MDKHHFKFLLPILFLAIAISGILLASNSPKPTLPSLATTPAPGKAVTTLDSPDTLQKLTMKEEKNNKMIAYIFSTSNQAGGDEKQIFTKTLDSSETLSIPYNAWSPDSKYIFLKQSSSTKTSYFTLTSTGAPIAKDTQTLDITDLFEKKYTDYKIVDVTGWAAPTLIIINTDKSDGGTGLSFWFDVTSQSFIPLSTHFN